MRRLMLGFLCLAAATTAVLSETQVGGSVPFRLTVDVARFRGPDDSTASVEVYYSIPQAGLVYLPDSAGLAGRMEMLLVVRKGDSVVYADRWLVPSIVRDSTVLATGMNLIGQYPLGLRANDYVISLSAKDAHSPARHDSVAIRVPVRPVPPGKPVLSDLELAASIRKGTQGTTFYKNTLDVVPNAGGVCGEELPCQLYVEAYNLLTPGDTSDYFLRTAIFNSVGREMLSRDRVRKRVAESTVAVDQVDVGGLHSGTYAAVVSLLDGAKKTLATTTKKFFVFNRALGVDSSLVAGSSGLPLMVLESMDETALDEEFREAGYEARDVEKSQFKKLRGAEAKRKFLSNFWRSRRPGFRDEYMNRVQFADANYKMMGKRGYRTDRGRVYIIYGPPDDIERHPSQADMKPYEIWSYHSIQGGVIFVFGQRSPTGDLEQLHSTERTEIHDEDWERYIKPQ